MNLISKSVRDTLSIGRKLSRHLKPGDIICLFGELGSGKTVFTKGVARGLGISENKITSPTFVLIRQYEDSRLPLYHFDLYRLKELKDIAYLGYQDYLYGQGVSVVEWADRLGRMLPREYLKIVLSVKGKSCRLLRFSGSGRRYKELLSQINEDTRH